MEDFWQQRARYDQRSTFTLKGESKRELSIISFRFNTFPVRVMFSSLMLRVGALVGWLEYDGQILLGEIYH